MGSLKSCIATKRFWESTPKRAFTLLELILVLAIIGLIGSIAVPALLDSYERQKVQSSADMIRISWEETRLQAMRTGQTQVFECVPGERDFSIRSLQQQSDYLNAGAGAELMTASGMIVETQSNGMLSTQGTLPGQSAEDTEKLEESISFVSCIVAGDMRAYTTAQKTGTLSTNTSSQPVYFYPDGSTSTAEVRIQNTRGDVRSIQLRGLTGQARVMSILNVASTPKE
ncbi:MAG: prepilin-type N-terminal cleavage/methylation domain-containing protein [Planctomycetales bacterium]|nr:prepilin-type N-terminal cleavage/methylation domain-containing protein [Planctomycetales bacterium]